MPAQHRLQVRDAQFTIVSDAPPDHTAAATFQDQPGRDVRLVIELADDDLGTETERLTDGETDCSNERRGIQPERDLVGASRVYKGGHAFAGSRDHRVDFTRLPI